MDYTLTIICTLILWCEIKGKMSVVIVDDTILSTYMEFNKSDNSAMENNDTVINHSKVDEVKYKKDMIFNTDNVEGKDNTINDSIEAEINCNKKEDQRQYMNNLQYFKNLIINLHEQNSDLMTEIIFLREDSSRKSNMINELISINRMSQEFKLSNNIDIHNNDMSSKEVRDVNIGVNKYTSMNAVYEFTQFPVYESTADTVNVSDTEEIVQCPTEILATPSDYLDDKSDDVNLSITTSFNSTEKTLGFRDILENFMSIPVSPNKLEAERKLWKKDYVQVAAIYLKERDNEKKKWPSNTILVTGDSILNNIEENRLSKKFNVKVRSFPGADICYMYDYITPHLRKEPAYIILHIGLNDAVNRSSAEIVKRVFRLKDHRVDTCHMLRSTYHHPSPDTIMLKLVS